MDLISPIQAIWKDECTPTYEYTSSVKVVEHSPSHTCVTRCVFLVAGESSENTLQAISSAGGWIREEITFFLKPDDVGGFREELLVDGIEEPGCADDRFEGSVGEILREEFGRVAE